jgi:hypothetical protein
MAFCSYYQAHVSKIDCWYVTAILRSVEHLVFDRTIDTNESIFEFYVPAEREQEFLQLMHYFENKNLVSNFKKLPNRLMDPAASL